MWGGGHAEDSAGAADAEVGYAEAGDFVGDFGEEGFPFFDGDVADDEDAGVAVHF